MKFNLPVNKKKMIISIAAVVIITLGYLGTAIGMLFFDTAEEISLEPPKISEQTAADIEKARATATEVATGVYIENIKEMSLKNSYYRLVELIWFRWSGNEDLDMLNNFRIYKGAINSKEIVKDTFENGVHYQCARIDITVTKNFKTRRFPIDTQAIRTYIESDYPIDRVLLKVDSENCGLNEALHVPGYNLAAHNFSNAYHTYDSSHGDPDYDAENKVTTSEFFSALKLDRDGMGLYAKCFIALLGTLTWVLLVLFINTHHHVDPLSMVPAALFGTVSNIMVGANLLPDALDLGLLEFVNIWGVMIIIGVAITIINVNSMRNKSKNNHDAAVYGKTMFYLILTATLLGNIILPLAAHIMSM